MPTYLETARKALARAWASDGALLRSLSDIDETVQIQKLAKSTSLGDCAAFKGHRGSVGGLGRPVWRARIGVPKAPRHSDWHYADSAARAIAAAVEAHSSVSQDCRNDWIESGRVSGAALGPP